MDKVILIKHHLLKNLRKVVAKEIKARFSKGEVIAIKTHMGEYGNLNYIRPPIVELVVDELKKIGAKPFVFDTPVAYSGERDTVEKYIETARKNGFTEESMGCSIVISNEGVEVKSKWLSKLKVARKLYEADGLVVLSHFKGHELSNFGGAIKNLGMGGVTKESKSVMHTETQPQVHPEVIGECKGCGTCVSVCYEKAISLKNGKVHIDYDKCFGCCACVDACPNKVLSMKTVRFSRALAESASFIVKKLGKKSLYISVLLDITDTCDCYPIGSSDIGKKVSPDIGILISDNIIAIEKASLDLVQKSTNNEFGKIFKSKLDEQLLAATDFGLGKGNYELEVLD
ncbi:MAG: DUF362 domain-containing protein [Candidatus Aenigmarchaeota archaeon]|nr:DUF362 domain-containing protein [Candidatus Aenigmarchaeota archaeon]